MSKVLGRFWITAAHNKTFKTCSTLRLSTRYLSLLRLTGIFHYLWNPEGPIRYLIMQFTALFTTFWPLSSFYSGESQEDPHERKVTTISL